LHRGSANRRLDSRPKRFVPSKMIARTAHLRE
jgi:hypothetical protein